MVFYDRGASLNLIQGGIAELRDCPLRVCDSPGKLRVGGGLEIDTVYGVYKVSFGPSTAREYTEVTCRGLPVLMEHFPEHSPEELNEEVYNAGIVDRSEPLPKKEGRAEVGLLLGITSTRIDPVLVHTLPNGLGIYRTPFVDQYGSQLAFGGPHQIFSRGGSKSYSKLMGALVDRTISPDPMVPKLDCTLVLQIPMELPGDNGSCIYPSPPGAGNYA